MVSIALVVVGFIFIARYARANRQGRQKDARRALVAATVIAPVCVASVIVWAYLGRVRF